MRKKYFSPMFAELELEFEDILWDSNKDNKFEDGDFEGGDWADNPDDWNSNEVNAVDLQF